MDITAHCPFLNKIQGKNLFGNTFFALHFLIKVVLWAEQCSLTINTSWIPFYLMHTTKFLFSQNKKIGLVPVLFPRSEVFVFHLGLITNSPHLHLWKFKISVFCNWPTCARGIPCGTWRHWLATLHHLITTIYQKKFICSYELF